MNLCIKMVTKRGKCHKNGERFTLRDAHILIFQHLDISIQASRESDRLNNKMWLNHNIKKNMLPSSSWPQLEPRVNTDHLFTEATYSSRSEFSRSSNVTQNSMKKWRLPHRRRMNKNFIVHTSLTVWPRKHVTPTACTVWRCSLTGFCSPFI